MATDSAMVGLVLSGGGAKGAYQAGALSYLAEVGFKPHMIAGTSIGALNGAVLASHQPFPLAVRRLNELWDRLTLEKIIHLNPGAAIRPLGYAVETLVPQSGFFRDWLRDFLIKQRLLRVSDGLFNPAPIERLIRETVNVQGLKTGIELWVAVFPSLNIPGLNYTWLLDFVHAATGTEAHWLRAQDFIDTPGVLYNLLLASAAIPFAFPKREINGQHYVDGGLADNVPLRALVKRGCTHAIVLHLSNGAAWSRHDFPIQIIEIRPQAQILKTETPVLGTLSSLLDFSPGRIRELKQRGYEDAKSLLSPIIETLVAISEQRKAHDSLIDSTAQIVNDDPL
jgi:NTE family protein